MAPVGEPVQQGAGESLGAKDLRPFLEGQVGGQHETMMLIGPTDEIEEQFGSCLGKAGTHTATFLPPFMQINGRDISFLVT